MSSGNVQRVAEVWRESHNGLGSEFHVDRSAIRADDWQRNEDAAVK